MATSLSSSPEFVVPVASSVMISFSGSAGYELRVSLGSSADP